MTDAPFDPGPPAAVECQSDGDRRTLIFVRDLRHAPERVWTALTEPDQLRAWSPYTADRSLARPGDVTLTMFASADEEGEQLQASVTQAEPPRVLEYAIGTDVVRWELEPRDSGTRLTLRHTVADADSVPKVAAGWHLCLAVAERLLDGRPVTPIRGEEAKEHGWEALRGGYAERLGVG
jgi:uncharacterized protein YndB with AHSA1/START domain